METENVLEKVALVQIDATIWSGRKKLKPEDITLGDGGELPPEEVASLGSKKVIGREPLTVFDVLKKKAQRLPEEIGVRFLGGYAVPVERVKEVSDHLLSVKAEFEVAREDFLNNYGRLVDEWIAEHPGFADSLRKAVPSVEQVARSLTFQFAIFQVTPAQAESGLGVQAQGLGGRLLEEVASDARRWMERNLASATEVSRRSLRPLTRIRGKLAALSFLSGAAEPLTQAIDDVLGECGNLTPITGGPLVRLKAMALLLADPVRSQQVVDASVVAKTIDGMWAPATQADQVFSDEAQECVDEEDEEEVAGEIALESAPHEAADRDDAEKPMPEPDGQADEEAQDEEEAETADSGFWF